jgi:serine/threonine-protein kinase
MMVDSPSTNFSGLRISPGTRLNGIYEIDHLIGIGGMGEIYKGHAIQTGDPVAIKLMLPELAENEAALALFRKEASALHHLQHEAIVRYYVFTVEPVLQRPYLAMEFVDGRSLSAILEDDGPLPFEAVRSLMQRLATGLQAAHERGIIHRDVTPDNIIIPGGDVGRAKIIDFGIARSTQLSEATVIGSGFAGKYNYVSPEQLGLFGGDVTAKSDIYSLGLVLVQALTGRALDMGGTQVQVVEKRRKVPDLGAIDMRFRPLLEKMLQPLPEKRPESMAAVAASTLGSSGFLRGLKSADAIKPSTRTAKVKPADSGRRSWRYGVAAILLAAVVAGGGAGYYYYGALLPFPNPPTAPPVETRLDPAGPTQIDPSVPLAVSRTEKIKQYVEQYDGGECFFIAPIAVGETRATIEGLGASVQPFSNLDAAFKRDNGFEADISLRQVTQAQCPAITFLGRLRAERARAPRLDIDKVSLRSGETMTGLVDRFGSRNVELLLVSDTGLVQNVSQQLRPGTDAKTFSIGMQEREGTPGSQPQLLLAVASPRPLDALKAARPVAAEQFFPAVLNEAQRTGQTLGVTARYFKLER